MNIQHIAAIINLLVFIKYIKVVINTLIKVIIIIILLCIYPYIEFYRGENLYMMSYSSTWDKSSDADELEEQLCYDESYSYNKKRDISIKNFEYRGFLFFKWFKVEYKKDLSSSDLPSTIALKSSPCSHALPIIKPSEYFLNKLFKILGFL